MAKGIRLGSDCWQREARRDGSVVARLKPGHTQNVALGCSTIAPTGYARTRPSPGSVNEEHNDISLFGQNKNLLKSCSREQEKRPVAAQILDNRGSNNGTTNDLLRMRALQ